VILARSSLLAGLALLAPALAGAQAFAPPPPSQGPLAPPAAPAQPPPTAPVTSPPIRPVRLAGTMGIDVGFTNLIEATMSDGSKQTLAANQGFFASIGAAFLPLLDGRLETQATIGIKGWSINASNGSASIVTFPLEVLEVVHVDPLRFAAGLVYLHRPSLSGKGVLDAADTNFDSSLGVVLEADWTWRARPGAPLLGFGPRLILQKFQVRGGGPVFDANALGFVMSFTGG
jgi:hypothetical protein